MKLIIMSAFYLNTYDVKDEAVYQSYVSKVVPIFNRYKAKVLAFDREAIPVEGTRRDVNILIQFESIEVALSCYKDPEYQAIKPLRIKSTINSSITLVKGL
jgi:uncharacterized protein (DUF1330 family)